MDACIFLPLGALKLLYHISCLVLVWKTSWKDPVGIDICVGLILIWLTHDQPLAYIRLVGFLCLMITSHRYLSWVMSSTLDIGLAFTSLHFVGSSINGQSPQKTPRCLLEDLSIRPLVRLALELDRLIPAPLVLQIRLIFLLGVVQLGEFIAFIVGGNVEGWESFVTTDEEDTLDDGVVTCAKDGGGTEEVLAGAFESIEKTAYQEKISRGGGMEVQVVAHRSGSHS